MKKIFRYWKSLYLVCCLVYVGWVLYVGQSEFHKVNRQYQALVNQLQSGRIRTVALDELAAECRRDLWERNILEEDACSTWLPEVVNAKRNTVEERLQQARERGFLKVVLFYTSFVVIFLLIPPLLIYLCIFGIVMLCKNIQIVR